MATHARMRRQANPAAAFSSVTTIGWIVDIDAAGHARVDFDGNCAGLLAARTLVRFAPMDGQQSRRGAQVLLGFIGIDTSQPVILGLLHESVFEPPAPLQSVVRIEGRRVAISAQDELTLQCGHSSVSLSADGRVLVKGSEVSSRASGGHKIKGASVAIN